LGLRNSKIVETLMGIYDILSFNLSYMNHPLLQADAAEKFKS